MFKWSDIKEELESRGYEVEYKGRGRNEIIAERKDVILNIVRYDLCSAEFWVFNDRDREITLNQRTRHIDLHHIDIMCLEADFINNEDVIW